MSADDHTDSPGGEHDHDRGLSFDVATLMSRRRALALLGGAGLASLAACTSPSDTAAPAASASTQASSAAPAASSAAASSFAPSSAAASSAAASSSASSSSAAPSSAAETVSPTSAPSAATSAAVTERIPEETVGPFPGNGSNGINVLTQSGIVRSDITRSYGTGSATAGGVPLTMTLRVLDIRNGAAPLAGAAVYVWHCDREGRYSLYTEGVTEENYLRGVQETDADGVVTFRSIYPAAYQRRWPHVHFEIYPSLSQAAKAAGKLRTSQLALPEDTSNLVYATAGYESSIANMARTPIDRDMVFSDGYSLQMATMTGSVASGFTATLNVPV